MGRWRFRTCMVCADPIADGDPAFNVKRPPEGVLDMGRCHVRCVDRLQVGAVLRRAPTGTPRCRLCGVPCPDWGEAVHKHPTRPDVRYCFYCLLTHPCLREFLARKSFLINLERHS